MTTKKQLGIRMDHATAHLMELTNSTIVSKIIESEFTHEDKMETLDRSESGMYNKEQQKHAAYYKKLKENMVNYDEVVLFGATNAIDELANLLKGDKNFEKIKVGVQHSHKMTENQEHAFVKKYFSEK